MRPTSFAVRGALALCLAITSLANAVATSAAQAPDWDVQGGHFYTQTNANAGPNLGFTIMDDANARFWSEFQRLGGVNVLGYPISNRFTWDGFTVQATQREILQWRPDQNQVVYVNVYDRLHDLKQDDWLQAFRSTPPPADTAPDAGKSFDEVKARHQAWLDPYPALKKKYFSAADPLQINGLPMAPVFDAGPFLIVRNQRSAIQQWKVDAPASGARAGDVTVTLGGDDAKAAGVLPDKAALTPAAPLAGSAASAGGGVGRNNFSLAVPHQNVGYGMNVLSIYNGGLDLDYNMVKGAGFNWVEFLLPWEVVNPAPGQYDWSQPDQIADVAAKYGHSLMVRIDKPPQWAAPKVPGTNSAPPNNMADLATFLTALAGRYKGRFHAYQIWDEPNLAIEWGGPGKVNAAQYVSMLQAAYGAIKAADPSAVVVGGSLSPTGTNSADAQDDLGYLKAIYAAGGGKFFDVLGAHGAGYNHAPDAPLGSDPSHPDPWWYFRRIEQLRAVMEANGDAGKQMWLTEFGWTSDNVNPAYAWFRVDESTKADYLVRAYQLGKTYPWMGVMFLWNFNYAALVGPNDEKSFWSIINPDHTGRPAYTSLTNMAK